MDFQPYCERNWRVDYNTIKVNYPQGPWTISSEQIEYFEEKAEWNGSTYIFEIDIKAKGWDTTCVMGRFMHGDSGIRDALATFAVRNGLEYRYAKSTTLGRQQATPVGNGMHSTAAHPIGTGIQNENRPGRLQKWDIDNAPKKKSLIRILGIPALTVIVAVVLLLMLHE